MDKQFYEVTDGIITNIPYVEFNETGYAFAYGMGWILGPAGYRIGDSYDGEVGRFQYTSSSYSATGEVSTEQAEEIEMVKITGGGYNKYRVTPVPTPQAAEQKRITEDQPVCGEVFCGEGC